MVDTHSTKRRYVYWVLTPVGVLLVWLGMRDRPDPVWQEAGHLIHRQPVMLREARDSVVDFYFKLHPEASVSDTAVGLQVLQGNVPVLRWSKFHEVVERLHKERKLVISGVTGTGSTNLSIRAAQFLAGEKKRIIQINCAPQFDLELHRQYIGKEENGVWVPGRLLAFWDTCQAEPDKPFVALIDNFDKINPETFFGPDLWESLSSKKDTAYLNGRPVFVPPNFYLLSVAHLGPGSHTDLNEEHFKRIGQPYINRPDGGELIEHLKRQAASASEKEKAARLEILNDTTKLQSFIYYFLKINNFIKQRYGEGYQLGHGTNVRKYYRPADRAQLIETFCNHVNSLRPNRPLKDSELEDLELTIQNAGLEPYSSFIARQIQFLQETGYFVEITMVGGTALLTAFAGWYMFRRREQLIRRYGDRAQELFNAFEAQQISAEYAALQLLDIKKEVDQLVLRRRLNYTEGLYFLAFIEDKVRRIEFARNVSENFIELFNTFMEDDILTESEYSKLGLFLESMRHKIPEETFLRFREKVDQAYTAGRG